MINEYLKQIIELDHGIETERKAIDEEVINLESETDQRISHLEQTVLEQTRHVCQNEYDQKIQQAEELKEREIQNALDESQKIKERYENLKEIAVDFVLKSLLET